MSAPIRESEDVVRQRARVEAAPHDAIAHRVLAEALDASGDYEASVASYRRALELAPDDLESIAGLGRLYVWRLHRPEDAREPCLSFVRRNGAATPVTVYIWLALSYLHDRSADQAWEGLTRDLAQHGDLRFARQGLATALYREGRYDEATPVVEALLRADPDDVVALPLMAAIVSDQTHDLDRADEYYLRAVRAHPLNRAAFMGWLTHLTRRGEPERGHAFVRDLMSSPEYSQMRLCGTRLWDGSSPDGKRMLLDCTMGFGDCIQFARFARLLHDDGGVVTIHCAPALHSLIGRVRGVAQVVSPAERAPGDWFLHPVASCALFNRSSASLGALVPYVQASPEAIAKWAPEIAPTRNLKVALTWASSAYLDRNNKYKFRSMTFEEIEPLTTLPGIDFYSLQCGEPRGELLASGARARIHDLGDRFGEFMDTAAVMAQMDLVISVDTAAAHLAGAMGRPTFLLLPYAPSFRWLVRGSREPWYPTMTVFRQKTPGMWRDAIAELQPSLADLAARHAAMPANTEAPAASSAAATV